MMERTQWVGHSLVATLVVMGTAAAACGSDGASPMSDSRTIDAVPLPDAPAGCARTPAPADRARVLVVSRPFGANSMPANRYAVLTIGTDGALSDPNIGFDMGTAVDGEIVFTPDGNVGFVPQKDGSIGVFRLDGTTPTVVHAAFRGAFYAESLQVSPDGQTLYIVDGNFRENGGGLYRAAIQCDGTLGTPQRMIESKLAYNMFWETPNQILVAARDIADSQATHDAHRVDLTTGKVTAGSDAFTHDEAIMTSGYYAANLKQLWLGDVNSFSGLPNRVAILSTEGSLSAKALIPVEDPEAIRVSPFAPLALVASTFGDAIFMIDNKGANGAYRLAGELTYNGASAKLPAVMAMIERGPLKGHVYVAENVSIRHIEFTAAGGAVDRGSLAFQGETAAITGALGVQP